MNSSATEESFEYFPENKGAIDLFLAIHDQWIVGFGGPVGINMAIALQFVQPLSDGTVLCPVDDIKEAIEGLQVISSVIVSLAGRSGK